MEGLGLLVLSVWLFRLLRAGKAPRGLVFGAYLAGAGLLRLVMEAFRGDFRGQPFLGLAPTAWMALVTAAAGAVVIAAAVRRRKASPAGSGGDAGAGRGGGFGQADRFRPAGRDVLAQEGQEVRDFLAREEQASQEGREGLEGQEVREG
jgi:hypothetical protein